MQKEQATEANIDKQGCSKLKASAQQRKQTEWEVNVCKYIIYMHIIYIIYYKELNIP